MHEEFELDYKDITKDKTNYKILCEGETYEFKNVHRTIHNYGFNFINHKKMDLYFRTSKIVEENIEFSSYRCEYIEDIFLEDDVVVIVCKHLVHCRTWTKKIELTPKKRPNRITKTIAQSRLDELNYDFTVIHWEGTTKPAKIKCNSCEEEITFKQGGRIYNTKLFGFDGVCLNCRNKSRK